MHPRKSSEIFGILRKISENVRKRSPYLRNNFGESSEIFGKWSEIFGKSSKTSSLVCLCNKQNITCSLVDMNFIFSCSTRHLTRSLRSLVRYRVEHSKIKFISTHGHVISSMYVSDDLEFSRRSDLDISGDGIESCWIELARTAQKNVVIGCVYRHPKGNRELFHIII